MNVYVNLIYIGLKIKCRLKNALYPIRKKLLRKNRCKFCLKKLSAEETAKNYIYCTPCIKETI
jgi:hypothetical protein